MARLSVAASQLSSNEISSLANIFKHVFQFYCDHYSPMMNDYLKEISTIVGLGFTAVLVDKTFISMYQERLGTFIRYSDIRESRGCIPLLSQHIAEMVDMGCRRIYASSRATYEESFCDSLKKALSHVSIQMMENASELNELIGKLFTTGFRF